MSISRCNAGRTLKTSQEKTLSISTNGGIEGMSKLKAKVGDTWITATSVQQLRALLSRVIITFSYSLVRFMGWDR